MGKKKSPNAKHQAQKATASKSKGAKGYAAVSSSLPLANIATRGSAPRASAFPNVPSVQESKAIKTNEEESKQPEENDTQPPVPDVEKFGLPEIASTASKEPVIEEMAEPVAAIEEVIPAIEEIKSAESAPVSEVAVEAAPSVEEAKPAKPAKPAGKKGKKSAEPAPVSEVAVEAAPLVEEAKPAKPAKPAGKKGKKSAEPAPVSEVAVEAAPSVEEAKPAKPAKPAGKKGKKSAEPAPVSEVAVEAAPSVEEVKPAKPAKPAGKKGKGKSKQESTETQAISPDLGPIVKITEPTSSMIEAIKALGDHVNLDTSCFQVKNIKELVQYACVKIYGTKNVRGLTSQKLAFKRNAITAAGFADYKAFKNATNYDFELLHFGDPAAKILIGYLEQVIMPDLAERLANKFAQLKPEGNAIRVNSGGVLLKKDGSLGAKGNVFITFDWPGKGKYNKEPNQENIIDAKNIPADVDIWLTKWEKTRTGKIPKYVYFALKHQKELAKVLGKKKLSSLSKEEKKATLAKIAESIKANKKELEGEAEWNYPALKNQYRVCSYSAIAKKIQKLGKGGFLLSTGIAHPKLDKSKNPEEFFSYKLRSSSQALTMKAVFDAILSVADNVNDILTAKGYLEMKTITPDIIARAVARLGYFKSSIMNLALPEKEVEAI